MENKVPTFPVALPICSHFLGIPYTESRRLVDEGLPLVATDHNPGTAPSGDMLEAVRLVLKMGLEPIEAIAAGTLNGAAAMELDKRWEVFQKERELISYH